VHPLLLVEGGRDRLFVPGLGAWACCQVSHLPSDCPRVHLRAANFDERIFDRVYQCRRVKLFSVSAKEHLRAALSAMIAEREELDRDIDKLRVMLGDSKRTAVEPTSLSESKSPPSVREIARSMAVRGEFTLSGIQAEAARRGNNADTATISSTLSRMKKKQELKQVGKGRYDRFDAPAHTLAVFDPFADHNPKDEDPTV
jgi:hypothetical protein